ncbi:extracellular solute-binding protein [Saccharopolyspora sp. K220]|uniref:ABC transporter substrate-binding protein n=1 Tax=Saccharopolyspora soli TaxID=2926618 RepID=UPI001F5954C4|nr:extracellular solute-binding protein [Saccharopolyspora soli]MCI2418187.1 extracellular solute-binding protein [Saccharopolyspora soli]
MRSRNPWSRRQFLVSAGVAGAAVLTGCGRSAPAAAPPTVPDDLVAAAQPFKGTSLTVLSQRTYAKTANQALETALSAFADRTGTTIKNSFLEGDAGNAVAKTDAAVKAGNGPDLAFFSASRFVAQFRDLGDLTDVSDVVAQLEQQHGKPADVARSTAMIDGAWWGIPYYSIGQGSLVRKDWLAEKGIPLDQLRTLADARDIALEISDPGKNRYGWGITINRSGDGNAMIERVMNGYGSSIVADDGRQVIFNSPETVDAISFLADLYANPRYAAMRPPGIESWTDSGNNEAWLAGVIGLTQNQFSVYADSKVTGNPVYPNTATLVGLAGPATDRPIETGDCHALVVFNGARNPGLAKVVAQYLVAGPPLLSMARVSDGLVMPVYQNVWDSDPFYRDGDPAFRTIRELMTQPLPIETRTGLRFPQAPSAGRQAVLQSYLLTDMMAEILQKRVPVQQAVADTHRRIADLFRQLGVPQ